MFSKYHYLNSSHNNAANVFVCMINDEIAGFISVLHFPHPKVKNMKRVHRLVVLPDYQGLGIGIKILNYIGDYYIKNKNRFTILTSAPSLIYNLKKNNNWNCNAFGRSQPQTGILKGSGSHNRITASFELKLRKTS
jgi:GNAT superfamily N-acetyltransferase